MALASRCEWMPTGTPGVEDLDANPILRPTQALEWLLGDPAVLRLGDELHMWVNTVFHGILHYKTGAQEDGDLKDFEYVETSVPWPGAVRPFVLREGDKVVLFYEQVSFPFYSSSEVHRREASVVMSSSATRGFFGSLFRRGRNSTTNSTSPEGQAWSWSSSTRVLWPSLDWEKEGQSRVGNVFIEQRGEKEWRMFYSAGAVHLSDSKIDEPRHLGIAEADSLFGEWKKRGTPLQISGFPEGSTLGFGSIKVLPALGALTGTAVPADSDAASGSSAGATVTKSALSTTTTPVPAKQFRSLSGSSGESPPGPTAVPLLALCNRITVEGNESPRTGSTVSLLSSSDGGESWTVAVEKLLAPTYPEKGWKMSYVYGYDFLPDPRDPEKILVFYNARDGWKGAYEAVGVSRIDLKNVWTFFKTEPARTESTSASALLPTRS